MEAGVITVASLSAIICIISTIIGLISQFKKDTKHDATQTTEHSTSVREEIKYISKGIEDIKYDTRTLTATMTNMNERLIRAEESIKTIQKDVEILKKGDN